MKSIADLHTHTTYSDGALTPAALVLQAKNAGIETLGITDHDSVAGVEEAMQCGNDIGVHVVAGIEMSVTWNQRELHLLGLFIDYKDSQLQIKLESFRERRMERAKKIVHKLNDMKIPLTFDSVLERAGNGVVCRPHIADMMHRQGFTNSFNEAFYKYIGDGRPAYEKNEDFPLEQAVRLISEAGGLSFLAHPGRSFKENDLFNIIKTGIDGIEVIHPSHTPELERYYRGIANEYYLLESGGSDYHGGVREGDKTFGRVGIPQTAIEAMQKRLNQHAFHQPQPMY